MIPADTTTPHVVMRHKLDMRSLHNRAIFVCGWCGEIMPNAENKHNPCGVGTLMAAAGQITERDLRAYRADRKYQPQTPTVSHQ